jgi:hypothetical protein
MLLSVIQTIGVVATLIFIVALNLKLNVCLAFLLSFSKGPEWCSNQRPKLDDQLSRSMVQNELVISQKNHIKSSMQQLLAEQI